MSAPPGSAGTQYGSRGGVAACAGQHAIGEGDPMDAQREYDRFGPWAIEVSEQDPAPPLFVPYLTRPERPLLSVKIPRHLERRNARPGMDLYDYLVSLYDDELVVLRRVGREVSTDSCRLRDVQHLRVTRCLLRGNIHLGLPGRPHDLPYNTVSDDLMLRLVDLIRRRYQQGDLNFGDCRITVSLVHLQKGFPLSSPCCGIAVCRARSKDPF